MSGYKKSSMKRSSTFFALVAVAIMLAAPLVLVLDNEENTVSGAGAYDVNYYDKEGGAIIATESYDEGDVVNIKYDMIPVNGHKVFIGWYDGHTIFSTISGARTFTMSKLPVNFYAMWADPGREVLASASGTYNFNDSTSYYVSGTGTDKFISFEGGNSGGVYYLILDKVSITRGNHTPSGNDRTDKTDPCININATSGATVVIQTIGTTNLTENSRNAPAIRISNTTHAVFEGRVDSVINASKTSEYGTEQSILSAIIGGYDSEAPAHLQIESGKIVVKSVFRTSRAAAIGSGYGVTGDTKITINGGDVDVTLTMKGGLTVTKGSHGAGIGTGGELNPDRKRDSTATININGGNVKVTINNDQNDKGTVEGAAIGTGSRMGSATVNIRSGATVGVNIDAKEVFGAGIGGGHRANGEVIIEDSKVQVNMVASDATLVGAGIGGGGGYYYDHFIRKDINHAAGTGTVTISDGVVDVRMESGTALADNNKNHRAAAIGGGAQRCDFLSSSDGTGANGRVTISGGTVTTNRINANATGNDIGPSYKQGFGTNSWIVIDGGTIKVSSGNGVLPINANVKDKNGVQVHLYVLKVRDLGASYPSVTELVSVLGDVPAARYANLNINEFHKDIYKDPVEIDPNLYIYLPTETGAEVSLEYSKDGKVLFYSNMKISTSGIVPNLPSLDLYYRVEYVLSKELINKDDVVHAKAGTTYEEILEVQSAYPGYAVPRKVDVTMGGDLEDDPYTPDTDYSKGSLSVADVDGKIIVNAVADRKLFIQYDGFPLVYEPTLVPDPACGFYIEGDFVTITLADGETGVTISSVSFAQSYDYLTPKSVELTFAQSNVTISITETDKFTLVVGLEFIESYTTDPNPADSQFDAEQIVEVTLTPKSDYVLTDVTVENGAVPNPAEFNPVDNTITVQFKSLAEAKNIVLTPVAEWKITHSGDVEAYTGSFPLDNNGFETTLTTSGGKPYPPLNALTVTVGNVEYKNFTYEGGKLTFPTKIEGAVVVNVAVYYALTLEVGENGSVEVSGSSVDGTYRVGSHPITTLAKSTRISLSVISDEGYGFAGWTITPPQMYSGDLNAHNISFDISESGEKSAKALFDENGDSYYYLSLTLGDNGSVEVEGSDIGDGTYTEPNTYEIAVKVSGGEYTVKFTETPDDDYGFDGWMFDPALYGDFTNVHSISFDISEYDGLTATFGLIGFEYYYLDLIVVGNGTVNVNGTFDDGDYPEGIYIIKSYADTPEVTFTANPDEGHYPKEWTVTGGSNDFIPNAAEIILNTTEVTKIVVEFVENSPTEGYRIALIVGEGGIVNVFGSDRHDDDYDKPGTYYIYVKSVDTKVTFTAEPETDYGFNGWAFSPKYSGHTNIEKMIVQISLFSSLEATFGVMGETYNYLILTVTDHGSVVVGKSFDDGTYSGPETYVIKADPDNPNVELEAVPNDGCGFVDWATEGDVQLKYENGLDQIIDTNEYYAVMATFKENNPTNGYRTILIVGKNGEVTHYGDEETTYIPGRYSIHVDKINDETGFLALPDIGYGFNGWTFTGNIYEGHKNEIGPISVKISDYKSIKADFGMNGSDYWYIILFVDDEGKVNVSNSENNGLYGGGAYSIRTKITAPKATFIVNPDDGYGFKGWFEIDESYYDNYYSNAYREEFDASTMFGVWARFQAEDGDYLALILGDNGGVEVDGSTEDGIYYGANTYGIWGDDGNYIVSFTAIPDPNYKFDGWVVDDIIYDDKTQLAVEIDVDESSEAVATFSSTSSGDITHYITSSADPGAWIDPELYKAPVSRGGSKTYKFGAVEGYVVSDVIIDGVSHKEYIDQGYYTFTNVIRNHTIEIKNTRAAIQLDVTITQGKGHVEYSINGATFKTYEEAVSLPENAKVVLRAYADDGYEFKEWSTSTKTYTTSEVSFSDVMSTLFIQVKFSEEGSDFPWMWVALGIFLLLLFLLILLWILRNKKEDESGSN